MTPEIQPTVITINDTPDTLERISRIAESADGAGFECLQFKDGKPAVEWAKDNQFDLAFVDYEMPTSGPETIKALRQIEEEQERVRSLIVLVSNSTPEELINWRLQECQDAGADGFVAMHFSNRAYQSHIQEFVKRALATLNKE